MLAALSPKNISYTLFFRMNGHMNGGAPPPSVPARRHSRAGGNQSSDGGGGGERPPQRPPKPGRLTAGHPAPEIVDSNRLADMDEVSSRKSSGSAGGGGAGGNGPENAEWYEYGCV